MALEATHLVHPLLPRACDKRTVKRLDQCLLRMAELAQRVKQRPARDPRPGGVERVADREAHPGLE